MYFSKECQSKYIRNTVSNLLVLARETFIPLLHLCLTTKRMQLARSTEMSSWSCPPAIAHPTLLLAWITNSTESTPLSSMMPEAQVDALTPWELSRSFCRRWAICYHSLEKKKKTEDPGSGGGCHRFLDRTVWAINISCAVHLLNAHPQA